MPIDCSSRRTSSNAGASQPIVRYSGIKPINPVDTQVAMIVTDNARLRLSLSAMCPKTMPPTGRSRNEIAKTAYVFSRAIVGSTLDGNSFFDRTTATMP